MTQTVAALYDTYDDAVAATRALAEAGIPVSDISIVSNKGARTWPDIGSAVGGLGKGLEATVGGVGETVGGLTKGLGETVGGLTKGLGETVGGLTKGLGETVGGLGKGLGATVGGVGETVGGVGEAVGGLGKGLEGLLSGLVGTLTGAGMPEREANRYAEGVRRGGILVSARVADDHAPSARKMLQH